MLKQDKYTNFSKYRANFTIFDTTGRNYAMVIKKEVQKMDKLKAVNAKWIMILYGVVVFLAGLAVNTACFSRFYQEELDSQLDSLRKYYD